jgi:cation diffusion facilitator CzcD-associated flavoprotein CzcO
LRWRNSQALPEGAVLVVGSGQSGAQIAEDLHLAGRKVHLAVGDAPRCARFYRGRDVVAGLCDMGYYDMPVQKHPLREGVRDNTNHYLTGRDGGRRFRLLGYPQGLGTKRLGRKSKTVPERAAKMTEIVEAMPHSEIGDRLPLQNRIAQGYRRAFHATLPDVSGNRDAFRFHQFIDVSW